VKIYGSLLSANVRKVVAAAIELGVPHELEEVNVYRGEGQAPDYLSLNPLGQIPIAIHSDLVLRESNAILLYLATLHGDNTETVLPQKSLAAINEWLFWESGQWQPMLTEIMGAQVGNRLLPELVPAPASAPDWEAPNCRKQLNFLESSLKAPWLIGTRVSLADFSVAAMTTYFKAASFPFPSYPNIARWYDSLNELPSWQKTEHPLWAVEPQAG